MPRLSGAAEPPALHRRGGSSAAPSVAAPAVASPAAPRQPAPARDAAPAPARPAPALPAAAPRARAEVDADAVPPPPKHDFLKEPKLYRQEDGTLGPTKPPPDPYTVANRRAFADLVHYARVNGGDEECTAGRSFRYGVGVSHAQHAAYLAQLGMTPERDAAGNWIGYDPSKEDPLKDDKEHPLYQVPMSAADRARDAAIEAAVEAELAGLAAKAAIAQ